MSHTLHFLAALLLAPPALFAQAKLEVANATKFAKRAWESAPAEKKAFWQQQRDALIHVKFADDTSGCVWRTAAWIQQCPCSF